MPANIVEARVLSNERIAPHVIKMTVARSGEVLPGQFFMLRAWDRDPLLSRPISTGDADAESLTFYLLEKGRGTRRIGMLQPGETLSVQGPLGNPFPIVEGKIALVGGGIGIAPLVYLSHQLPAPPDVYLGFQSDPYALDDFRAASLHVATEDGSVGHRGFVTALLDPAAYDAVYACGPTPMLSVLQRQCAGKTRLILSLEAHMACATGACLGCSVPSKDGYVRVCKDGPVFEATEVML